MRIVSSGWKPRKGAFVVLNNKLQVFSDQLSVQDDKVVAKFVIGGEEIVHEVLSLSPDEMEQAKELIDPSTVKRDHPVIFSGDFALC